MRETVERRQNYIKHKHDGMKCALKLSASYLTIRNDVRNKIDGK